MKYTKNTDHTKSPAALIRHLHSYGLLDRATDGDGETFEEVDDEVAEVEEPEVKVKGQEKRSSEEEEATGKPTFADIDWPPEGVEVDSVEYYRRLKDLPWSLPALEQALYLSLPAWVQAALLCNLLGHVVKSDVPGFSFPVRMMSYLLLPYTLPASAIFQLNYRFMRLAYWDKTNLLKCFKGVQESVHWKRWNRKVQEKAHWLSWIGGLQDKSHWPTWVTGLQEKAHLLWWDVRQVVRLLVRVSVSSLKTMLPGRLPSLPFSLLHFPAVSLQWLQSIPLPSIPLPSIPFPSIPLPSIPLPSIPFPSLCSLSFFAPSLLLRILPLRFLSFGSAPQTEPGPARGTIQRKRHSMLRFHLSTTSSASNLDPLGPSSDTPCPPEPPRAFSLLINLQLEVDEQPEFYPVLPQLPAPLEVQLSPEEVEDEGLCSPHISFLGVREEDVRDEDSDVEDSGTSGIAPLHSPPIMTFASKQSPNSIQLHALNITE
ncbi:uncharacterized protein LOC143104378 isoform X1 [Alosa pseudoharengus]|uniref:uncharacterized protein LOC143104378 isoform X1 n=1 Tax=Alosa pseudoharengus TaxID=34774 RepID=UPI003F886F96